VCKKSLKVDCLALALLASLTACATENDTLSANAQSIKQSDATGILTQERSIDWDRASEDASQSGVSSRSRTIDSRLNDAKGYSAVINSDSFDMLIDASNQMMLTDGASLSEFPQDFDGKYQSMEMGGQLTIGRYGALYAIQFICTDNNQRSCIVEQTAREIVQSLQVQQP